MRTILILMTVLCSGNALAADGIVSVNTAKNRENSLNVTVHGAAAKVISNQLEQNGVRFKRDSFSGALVQYGHGIRCIDQNKNKALYCHLSITGAAVSIP